MITIPRSLARRLRVVFSRGLGVSRRTANQQVQFHADENDLSIGIVGNDVAIAYHHPAQHDSSGPFAVPLELFKRCEGTKDEPVTISRQGDEVVAEWTDAGIPQVARFPVVECKEALPLPDVMQANDPELLTALREAAETTDPDVSSRYVLRCLRLRGSGGHVAGTDGRQLYMQDGFEFPWEDDLLVPACRAFTSSGINTRDPVEVGCTDKWVVLRTGPWTIHLRIEKEGRFPRVDEILPAVDRKQSTLRISGSDAAFLAKAVRRLPARKQLNSPVTVDLNGSIAIRAKGEDQPAPTELVLTGSERDGDAVRFNMNREFLARAVQLGFRDVELYGPETPACCRDGRRVYLWCLLGKEGAIVADPDAVRIESPAETEAPRATRERARKGTGDPAMVASRNGQATEKGRAQSVTALIEDAETLKASLRESLGKTNVLIAGLKRQRRQTRLMRSTLRSLKDLQAIDG